MKEYKLEVLYDGTWVEDVIIKAETDTDAAQQVKQQARDNLEVRHII